jgi:hypothetical protein
MLTGAYPFDETGPQLAQGLTVPFTPIAKYVPDSGQKWQKLFEHGFARELSCRHDSANAFLSELQHACA